MGSDPVRKRILLLNRLLASLEGGSVIFIDSYNIFINIKGNILPSLMPDYIHLSNEGYKLVSKPLLTVISEIFKD
jgi:lysophospholipase L1-like esterase